MNDTAESRWRNLETYRSIYLRRAIDCSALTIPSLIPESDQNSRTVGEPQNSLRGTNQGTGARGVSSLAAKLLLTLMPPAQPFFRLTIDETALQRQMAEMGISNQQEYYSRIDEVLSGIERQALQRLDRLGARPALFEAIKHLLVGGNALLYAPDDSIRVYGLRSYCIDRDPEDNTTEIVIRELVARQYLPAVARARAQDGGNDDEPAEVFTHVLIDPGEGDRAVQWYQEFAGKRIPRSAGFSSLRASPWIPLRLTRIAGESYGRGLVEEVIGDLQNLDSLYKAIREGALISAKSVFLVNPNGVTRADVLASAENGAIVPGNINDVQALRVDKVNDYATALQTIQLIERRLQFSFLLNEALQRDAERVTAEEIRVMAEQLEQGLGGVYSVLSAEMQLPLIRRVIFMMERAGEITRLPEQFIEPQITTGLDAIGRGNDKQRLTNFLTTVATALGPDQFMRYINPTELVRRFAASDGIATSGLVRTEQEIQAMDARQQQVALAQQIAQGTIANGVTPPQSAGSGGGNGGPATGQPGPAGTQPAAAAA